jgi:UDP-N-acetylglucosamine--N-acetylmuramyl-(pentapeptide) pyrophosphoryl-undecaprenol N-acetylglucosamine transferase
MTSDPLHFVFAGGGTGGHLFPGLAVAERLVVEVPDARITFAGSGKQLERREVAAAGFDYLVLPCRPLPRGAREAWSFLLENLAGYLAAARLLDEQRVDGVVGLGGYASVPMARAARRCGVPLVLLEQNAVPGRATRWLARSAALVCAGLAQTRARLRCRCPVRVTGTPIRKSSQEPLPLETWRCGEPTGEAERVPDTFSPRQLIVLGGSSGARTINRNVPRALYKIGVDLAGWKIVHQSGETDLEATRQLYRKLGLEAAVAGFIDRMPDMLAASDLAVCRAGGTTLAELAAAGLPAVLLPYPHATNDHQRRNAEVFSKAGGSVTLDECTLSGRLDDHLAEAIRGLLCDSQERARMSAAMRRLAHPDAAAEVAALILQEVRRRSPRGLPAAA